MEASRVKHDVTQLWPLRYSPCEPSASFSEAFQLCSECEFHIADLRLQTPSAPSFVCVSAERRRLRNRFARISLNDTALSGRAHLSYDNAYLRPINFEQLSGLIAVIWDSGHKA